MKWTDREIELLRDNYSTVRKLSELSKKLGKSKRAIQHKAARIGISRPRFPSDKPSKRQPRTIIEKRYYEKNKKKIYEKRTERKRKLKETIVNILGGKCTKCGYNKSLYALDFHHLGNKEVVVSRLIQDDSKKKALKEAEKCILLCANCHRELHHEGL